MTAMVSLRRKRSHWTTSPWATWLLVLVVISSAEYTIMLLLPRNLAGPSAHIFAGLIDAVILTIILGAMLWWTLVRPLRKAAEMRERFLADLFSAIEDERRRTAHELHDGVGQSLTLLVSGLRSLPDVTGREEFLRRNQNLINFSERALSDVKQLAKGLRPSLLDDLGLVPAIERLAEDLHEHQKLDISLDVEQLRGLRLPEKAETSLFRILQEALNNIAKHADARRVSVRLSRQPKSVLLQVFDDGRGIDPIVVKAQANSGGHMGMVGMRERAAQLDGEFSVDSSLGKGTRITVRLPLELTNS